MNFLSGFGEALAAGLENVHGSVHSAYKSVEGSLGGANAEQPQEEEEEEGGGGGGGASEGGKAGKGGSVAPWSEGGAPWEGGGDGAESAGGAGLEGAARGREDSRRESLTVPEIPADPKSPEGIMARMLKKSTELREQSRIAEDKHSMKVDEQNRCWDNPRTTAEQKESLKIKVTVLHDKARDVRAEEAQYKNAMEDFRSKHPDLNSQPFFSFDLRTMQDRKVELAMKIAQFDKMDTNRSVYSAGTRQKIDLEKLLTGSELGVLEGQMDNMVAEASSRGLRVPRNYMGVRVSIRSSKREESSKSPTRQDPAGGSPTNRRGSIGGSPTNRRGSIGGSPEALSNRRGSIGPDGGSPLAQAATGQAASRLSPARHSPERGSLAAHRNSLGGEEASNMSNRRGSIGGSPEASSNRRGSIGAGPSLTFVGKEGAPLAFVPAKPGV